MRWHPESASKRAKEPKPSEPGNGRQLIEAYRIGNMLTQIVLCSRKGNGLILRVGGSRRPFRVREHVPQHDRLHGLEFQQVGVAALDCFPAL